LFTGINTFNSNSYYNLGGNSTPITLKVIGLDTTKAEYSNGLWIKWVDDNNRMFGAIRCIHHSDKTTSIAVTVQNADGTTTEEILKRGTV